MDKNPEQQTVDGARRGFLRKAGLAGGAAAAVVATGVSAAPEAPADAATPKRSQGYHETEHVRAYYRTARI